MRYINTRAPPEGGRGTRKKLKMADFLARKTPNEYVTHRKEKRNLEQQLIVEQKTLTRYTYIQDTRHRYI